MILLSVEDNSVVADFDKAFTNFEWLAVFDDDLI
jgi:hypothetical protein